MKSFTSPLTLFLLTLLSSSSIAHRPSHRSLLSSKYELESDLLTTSAAAISDFFTFEVFNNDNGGVVSYVDQVDAASAGIFSANKSTGLRFGVDMTPGQVLRKSVRLHSKTTYNGGLFVFDVKSMPVGFGFWPALWMVGPDWPNGGEVDIIEGVHNTTINTLSTHTSPGCYQGTTGYSGVLALGGANSTDCDANETNDQGCGVRSPYNNSFGVPFNEMGGGVYAWLWDTAGLTTWFFPRYEIPIDISLGVPNPTGWGLPANYVSAANCSTSVFFQDMSIVINTAVCGTWPSGVWRSSLDYDGEDLSPANITGYSTCEAYQAASPTAIHQWWEINSIRVYQKV